MFVEYVAFLPNLDSTAVVSLPVESILQVQSNILAFVEALRTAQSGVRVWWCWRAGETLLGQWHVFFLSTTAMVKKHELPLPSEEDIALLRKSPTAFEDDNVHKIYDEIANHFSSTRYKPWPIISRFLQSIEKHAVGLDAGCGNGKYMPLAEHLFGLDRSVNLLKHAQRAGDADREVVLADTLHSVTRRHFFVGGRT